MAPASMLAEVEQWAAWEAVLMQVEVAFLWEVLMQVEVAFLEVQSMSVEEVIVAVVVRVLSWQAAGIVGL